MELNICHLYPDLLNSYGDIGNVIILKYRAEKRGITVKIHQVSLNEAFDDRLYDIVIFGGGQDFEQSIVSKDLLTYKGEALKRYIEDEKVLLAICGGYQLLGQYYINQEGKQVDGLKALPIYTEAGSHRAIGNIIIDSPFDTLIGFENHSGRTYINHLNPLGKVITGQGNNGKDQNEGCIYKNTYGTYLHGPVLSKNPEFCDYLIETALSIRYRKRVQLEIIPQVYEDQARSAIIRRNNQPKK